MSEEKQPSAVRIHLQAAGEQDPRPALLAGFRFAPDQPAVGQPGKDPGDLFLVEASGGSHTVIVSLGKPALFSPEMARKAGGRLGKWLVENGAQALGIEKAALKTPAGGAA